MVVKELQRQLDEYGLIANATPPPPEPVMIVLHDIYAKGVPDADAAGEGAADGAATHTHAVGAAPAEGEAAAAAGATAGEGAAAVDGESHLAQHNVRRDHEIFSQPLQAHGVPRVIAVL